MKITFFSTHPYDKIFFDRHNADYGFMLEYLDTQLNRQTVSLAEQCDAVCVFVNDKVDETVIAALAAGGTKVIALRCAGFNNVDLEAAKKHGLKVCRVPAYSPEAVAEHALAMILTLNRKTHKAYNRVREQNFALNGLLGFNLHGRTIGVIGTGNIGKAFAKLLAGIGCKILAYDVVQDPLLAAQYVPLETLLQESEIISLHCPLNEHTRHMINKTTLERVKKGVMLINTSRGGLICTQDVIDALKSGTIGYLGIDVYEQEEKLFFRDLSADIIQDDTIQRLMSFPNVLVTAHQAFFTDEALMQIAVTTLQNVKDFSEQGELSNKAALLI